MGYNYGFFFRFIAVGKASAWIIPLMQSRFMMSLSDDKQTDVIVAFNTASRYLGDILNTNNVYFHNMVCQTYPSELQLNKANTSDTEGTFLDLQLSISNVIYIHQNSL